MHINRLLDVKHLNEVKLQLNLIWSSHCFLHFYRQGV